MKVHSVKSNAKRAARKLAEKFPGLVAVEPLGVAGGGWNALVAAREGFNAATVPAEAWDDVEFIAADGCVGRPVVQAEAVVLEQADTLDGKVAQTVAMPNGEEVVRIVEAEDAGACYTDLTVPSPTVPSKPKPTDTPRPPKPTAQDIATAASILPPPTRSTPEEIEARRAERRTRVEAEKANGIRDRRGNKVDPEKVAKGPTRGAIIVALASRPGGVTVDDLMTATGWQRHTLRGYIAGTLRKRGHDLKSIKGQGDEPSRYVIEAVS